MTPTETQIETAHQTVRGLDARADAARAERDQIIRAAIASGMSAYRVAQITGLTQPAIYKIRDAR